MLDARYHTALFQDIMDDLVVGGGGMMNFLPRDFISARKTVTCSY
jgi:hypothetical protein